MPRNSSGVYSLPQAAFIPNSIISSAAVNSDFADIAVALTGSLPVDGSAGMTGPFKVGSGNVGAPGIAFTSDTNTGFYLAGSHQIGWAANGAQQATFNSNGSVTWQGGATLGGNGSFTGTLGVTGAVTLSSTLATGNTTIIGTASISSTASIAGKLSLTSTDSVAIANGTTGQRNGAPTAGDFRYNSTLNCFEGWNGTSWVQVGKAPTVQTFVSGSATYTPTTGTVRIRVRMVGGGGGGGASSTNNGAQGTQTSFASWTCGAGAGGGAATGTGGGGGIGGINGTGTLIVRVLGGAGAVGGINFGGAGGNNPLGGGGGGQGSGGEGM